GAQDQVLFRRSEIHLIRPGKSNGEPDRSAVRAKDGGTFGEANAYGVGEIDRLQHGEQLVVPVRPLPQHFQPEVDLGRSAHRYFAHHEVPVDDKLKMMRMVAPHASTFSSVGRSVRSTSEGDPPLWWRKI